MSSENFDAILIEADALARQGNWEGTYNKLKKAIDIEPDHAGTLTGLGTCMIQMNRPEDAIPYFREVVLLAPDVPEAYNNLGVAFALTGNLVDSGDAYEKAIEVDGDHVQAWKNLAQVYLQQEERVSEGVQILASVVKAHPDDIEALMLMAYCYKAGEEYESARTLYNEVLLLQPDNEDARELLAQLPLEQSDVRRIARPEHAKKLSALKGLVKEKRDNGKPSIPVEARPQVQVVPRNAAVCFLGPPEYSTEFRLGVPAKRLAESGRPIKVGIELQPDDLGTFDTFVFANPHYSNGLTEALGRCVDSGKYVIVDIDRDFQHIPDNYPGYQQVGPGNKPALQRLEECLLRADVVTVSSPVLADRYGKYVENVIEIPYSWNNGNDLWDKPSPRRETINIGITGTHVSSKDVFVLKKTIARLMREDQSLQLVIGADEKLYQAFSNVPESKRMFLPPGRIEDYPFMLAHFDILLVPLRSNDFNQAKADFPLMEAGIRRIPWVASPVAPFKEWEIGGLFAEKREDWFELLKKLVGDEDLRAELGEAGRQKAEKRESANLVDRWVEVLDG